MINIHDYLAHIGGRFVAGLPPVLARGPSPNAQRVELLSRRAVGKNVISRPIRHVIPIKGIVTYDLHDPPYATAANWIANELARTGNAREPFHIILDINSTGGTVKGVIELSNQIWEMRRTKRLTALINPYAEGTAYWIASQAHTVSAISSAMVGGIGVAVAHLDQSRFDKKVGIDRTLISTGRKKTHGNPFEPLALEAAVE